MKTETEIAREMIEKIKNIKLPKMSQANMSGMIISHLASCQRFLEFLKDSFDSLMEYGGEGLGDKITDIQNAIKIYEEAGIK